MTNRTKGRTRYLLGAGLFFVLFLLFVALPFGILWPVVNGLLDNRTAIIMILASFALSVVMLVLSWRFTDADRMSDRLDDVKRKAKIDVGSLPGSFEVFKQSLAKHYQSYRDQDRTEEIYKLVRDAVSFKKRMLQGDLPRLAKDARALTPWSKRSKQALVFRGFHGKSVAAVEKMGKLNEAMRTLLGNDHYTIDANGVIISRPDQPPVTLSSSDRVRFILSMRLNQVNFVRDRLARWNAWPGLMNTLRIYQVQRVLGASKFNHMKATSLIWKMDRLIADLEARFVRRAQRYFGRTHGPKDSTD